jgi:hypothetical protein
MAGSRKHDNEPSDSTETEEIFDDLSIIFSIRALLHVVN